eukprot:Skav217704  [mRNA]  locus=scaffold2294:100702:106932:- [translate_table: standard]
MRAALRSWAKYVPPYLLKSLCLGATVGFHENEVSILFCPLAAEVDEEQCGLRTTGWPIGDIDGFRETLGNDCLVLAVFNAPNEVVDHEEHAVESATAAWRWYGVLGDSVNVAARLKSLNSHFGTSCLVSDESLEEALGAAVDVSLSWRDLKADDLHKSYVARPVGNLVLKGRKSPTKAMQEKQQGSWAG